MFSLLEARLIKILAMAPTLTARAAALSTIDEEIFSARHLTYSLLSHRNAVAPISTLPPELLARIFRFHVLGVPPWSGVHKLGWIAVAHVCRQWRQVALGDSSLWATITGFFSSAEWMSELLVRARNMPLVIYFEDTPSLEIPSMLPPHISHIHELRLRNLSPLHYQAGQLEEICSLEAPVLEHFELTSDGNAIKYGEVAGTTLFNGRTPKLRTISLSLASIPWSLIPRGQLTQLKILAIGVFDFGALFPDDSNQLIDLLVNSPELEVLVLEYCLPSVLSQVSHGQQPKSTFHAFHACVLPGQHPALRTC